MKRGREGERERGREGEREKGRERERRDETRSLQLVWCSPYDQEYCVILAPCQRPIQLFHRHPCVSSGQLSLLALDIIIRSLAIL